MSNNISSNTSNNVPGLLLPTQKGMLAGNPRDSAIAESNAATLKLQSLRSIGGGRYLKKKRGGAAAIPVAQFNMQYTPQGGPDQVPNSIIQQNASIGTQNAANSVFDKYATQMGGYSAVHMNTNTNQYQWGCYSGGKKYKTNKKKGMKMSKKKRTSRRSTKTKKLKINKTRKYRNSKHKK
jgi:hypothetical protein